MEIVGYLIHGNKQYVVFRNNRKLVMTDGFSDRKITERNREKYVGYRNAEKSEIDIERITARMRQSRPWHPLLELLREEVRNDR